MSTRLCLFGPTGSGKSTLAAYLKQHLPGQIIKIADPIYEMQRIFYSRLGKTICGQDGELLQFLGYKIEKEQPQWLAREFLKKVTESNAPFIINDDCRLNSYPLLLEAGFIFIRVYTRPEIVQRRLRQDHIRVDPDHPVEVGFEQFRTDFTINNEGALADSFAVLEQVVETILRYQK